MDYFHFKPDEWEAVFLSVKVAILCTLLTLPLAVGMGWLLARREFRGKSLVESVICLPLVMPPVTVGYLLLVVLGTRGLLGSYLWDHFNIRLAFCFNAAVIASAVVSFPLFVRSVRVAMELADPSLEEAARQLGAGSLRRFLTVTLPLALPGIVAGLSLSFARSLGEFGATMTFAANIEGETRTLPLAIYSYMNIPGAEGSAMRLAALSAILALVAFVASEMLLRRSRMRRAGHET